MNKKYVLDFSSWLAENKSVSGFRLNEAEESGISSLNGVKKRIGEYFLYKTEMFKNPNDTVKFFETTDVKEMKKMGYFSEFLKIYILLNANIRKEDIIIDSQPNKGTSIGGPFFEKMGVDHIGFIPEDEYDSGKIGDLDVIVNYRMVSDDSFIEGDKQKNIKVKKVTLDKFLRVLYDVISDNGSDLPGISKDWKKIDWYQISTQPFKGNARYQSDISKSYETHTKDLSLLGVYKEGEIPTYIQKAEKDPEIAKKMLPTPELLASVPVLKTAAENFAKKGEQKSK